jgi:hypothetical protein
MSPQAVLELPDGPTPPGSAGEAGPSPTGPSVTRGLPRPVLGAHAATLAAAFFVWLYLDRHLWFYGDEWDFLVRRGVFHAQLSLWAPHNEHWSTLPILLWRGIFALVHLSHYWPYVVALLVLHVSVVHLFWRRCLREGISPRGSTALALLLALLGTAAEDLTWAFQVGFLGSVAFGLLALELAEAHRRQRLASAGSALAAVGSLMCSNIGVAMVVGLGLVALARRGWRRATALLALPVVAFVAWYAAIGYQGTVNDHISLRDVLRAPGFVWDDTTTDFARALSLNNGPLSWVGPVLVVCLLVWLAWNIPRWWRQHPAVIGLMGADLAFHVMAAVARDRFGVTFSPSRYVYMDVVFLFPGFAVAVRELTSGQRRLGWYQHWRAGPPLVGEAAARRRVPAGVLAVALLAASAGGNLDRGVAFARSRTAFVLREKQQIEASAQVLAGGQRAISLAPIRFSGALTVQGMLSLERRHLLPHLPMTPIERATALTLLDVEITARREVAGSFTLLSLSRGAIGQPGRTGCLTVWARPHARSPRLALRLSGRDQSAALHLATGAGTVRGLLDPKQHPLVGSHYVVLTVPSGGGWLSDAVPAYDLVLAVPPGRSTFCGLSVRGRR